ncbi:MAG TPA: OmpH family outer membrane protein [Geobacteraceae bacterium]
MKRTVRLLALIVTLGLAAPLPVVAAEATSPVAAPVAATPAPPAAPAPAAVEAPGKPDVPPAPDAEKKKPVETAKPTAIRIGYVEMTRFGSETEAGKAARSQVKVKTDALKKQISARQKQLEKQKNQLDEKLPGLAPKERTARVKEFEKKYEEYKRFVEKAEKELVGLEEEVSRKLYGEIESAAGVYGKANGLAAIVVKRNLLFTGSDVEAEDVTGPMMKLVDSMRKKR